LQNPDFSFSPIDPMTIEVNYNASTFVTLNSLQGFSGAVTLDGPDPATGFGVLFTVNPANVPKDGSVQSGMGVQLAASILPGTYTFDITGTSGSLTHKATVTVNVIPTMGAVARTIDDFGAAGCIDNIGVTNAFKAKVTVAQSLNDARRIQPAVNALAALLYQVNAQAGKHLLYSCVVDSQTVNPVNLLTTDIQALIQSMAAAAPNPLIGNVVTAAGLGVGNATVTLSGNSISATSAITDVTGFYYFPVTSGLKPGSAFQVSVPLSTKKKGVASQQFIWSGAQTLLNNLVFE
jgi:hypothetical protein